MQRSKSEFSNEAEKNDYSSISVSSGWIGRCTDDPPESISK